MRALRSERDTPSIDIESTKDDPLTAKWQPLNKYKKVIPMWISWELCTNNAQVLQSGDGGGQ
jgi:hypothetical protein